MSQQGNAPPAFKPPPAPQDPAQAPAQTLNEQVGTGPGTPAGQEMIRRQDEQAAIEQRQRQLLLAREVRAERDRLEVVWPAFDVWQSAIENRPSVALVLAPSISSQAGLIALVIYALMQSKGQPLIAVLERVVLFAAIGAGVGYLLGLTIQQIGASVGGSRPANPDIPHVVERELREQVRDDDPDRWHDLKASWREMAEQYNRASGRSWTQVAAIGQAIFAAKRAIT